MFENESDFKRIVSRLNVDDKPNPVHRENLRRQMLQAFNESSQQAPHVNVFLLLGKTIMQSPITKFAAAVVTIIAVLIGVHQFGNSMEKVAFADVVRPILTARTATYKITLKIPNMMTGNGTMTVESEGMFMEPGYMREATPAGRVKIVDFQKGKMLLLNTEKKTAKVYEQNIPDEVNIFSEIRKRIKQAQQVGDESVEFLGKQKFDGEIAIGYRVREPPGDVTVWADAETLLPLRIEYSMTEMVGEESSYIITDIAFDVELDESLFSSEIPEGYTVETRQMIMSDPKERDLIEAFRLWTQTTGGKFPSDLKMKSVMAEFTKGEGLKNKWQHFEKVAYGITFAHLLPDASDWHYVGKDVKFGDANTAVFWYRTDGSKTYRVIYGDLSVKNVSPENLPK
jgi:outer membrane lipoprotein-sorting protein